MDDPSRFTSINEYYTFIYAISYMMLVELGIWIYNFKGWLKRPDKKNNDYGTILSMLGNAFCFRSVFSPFIVILILMICYGIRIKVEEKALHERFGKEFENYCLHSWRLIPFIW